MLNLKDIKPSQLLAALCIFAVAFILGFFVNEQINNKKIVSLKNELSLTQTDLEFANKDQPRIVETRTKVYPVNGLPIHSDLFVGKEVDINDLLFKGKNLKEHIIYMSKKDQAFPVQVTVWDYQSDNSDRFNHSAIVNKFRIHKGIEYINPDNKNVYNAKSGFAWNKAEQKLSKLYESTSNHVILVSIEDTNVIVGNTYWDGSIPEDLEAIADGIGFN